MLKNLCHGGNGQMSTLGLESVLIGDVVDLVGLAIISNEAVGSTHRDSLVLSSNVVQLTYSLSSLSIGGFPAKKEVSVS